jgi:hypothetical protein
VRQPRRVAACNRSTLPQRIAVAQGNQVARPCRLGLEVTADRRILVSGRVICRPRQRHAVAREAQTARANACYMLRQTPRQHARTVRRCGLESISRAAMTAPSSSAFSSWLLPQRALGACGVEYGPRLRRCAPLAGLYRFRPTEAEVRMYAPLTRGEAVAKPCARRERPPSPRRPLRRFDTSPLRRPAARCCPKWTGLPAASAEGLSFARGGCRKCCHAIAAHRANDAVLAQPLRLGTA